VQRALTRIAADELQHAELAWRFVRWALELGEPNVEHSVAAELDPLEREAAQPPPLLDAEFASAEHGVLASRQRAELRRLALAEIVLPCGRALLARRRSPLGASGRASVARAAQAQEGQA